VVFESLNTLRGAVYPELVEGPHPELFKIELQK
jgi:hypothetical protein